LYNSIPKPGAFDPAIASERIEQFNSVVDATPIMNALWRGSEMLAQIALPPNAPPVFLLDSDRRIGRRPPSPGCFDNRSVSFATDFPSAIFLRTHGISRATLVQWVSEQPQPDLAHTLRRWQDAGIVLQLKRLDIDAPPTALLVERPSWFGAIWYRVCVAAGLKPSLLGGYGGIIGESSGG
jgi:hypothetical protein